MTAWPRRLAALCNLLLSAGTLVAAPLACVAAGPATAAPSPTGPADSLGCVGPDHTAIRLERVASLDLDAPLATKARSSSYRRTPIPAEVLASGAIPAICATADSLIFTRVEVGDPLRIPLKDNPSFTKTAYLSPSGTFAAVRTTFNAGAVLSPEEAEKAEGGEFPMMVTVYGRSGAPLFTTTGTSADLVQVTNGGAVIVSDVWTGGRYVATTAATRTAVPRVGDGESEYAASADGSRIVVASTRQMVGTTPANQVPGWPVDWRVRQAATVQVVVGLFDGGGRQLWLRSVPGVNRVNDIEISDDGTRVALSADYVDEPRDPRLPVLLGRSVGFLLDGRGEIVATGEWPFIPVIGRYNADLTSFELAWPDNLDLALLDLSGHVRVIPPPIPRPSRDVRCASRAISADLNAYAIWRKRHPFLVLSNAAGEVVCCRSVEELVSPLPAKLDGEDPAQQPELPPVHISLAGSYLSVFSPPSITVFRLESRAQPQSPASKGGSR